MVGSRSSRTRRASVFQLAATGNPFLVESFMNALNPKAAAKSPEAYNEELVGAVVEYLPLGTKGIRKPGGESTVKAQARVTLNCSCVLITDGAFDSSSLFAAHLIESSGADQLEVECYSVVYGKMIAEHVVIVDGNVIVCESRPWRKPQPNEVPRTWGGYKLLFESRAQTELEEIVEKEASMQTGSDVRSETSQDETAHPDDPMQVAIEFAKKAQDRKREEGKLGPIAKESMKTRTVRPSQEAPVPWQTHRDDFLAAARTAVTDALEEKFERQVSLLSEIVTPVEYDDTFIRSVTMRGSNNIVSTSAYAQHMRKVYLNYKRSGNNAYSGRTRVYKPLFDVVCFQVADKKTAFLQNVCNLGDIPFQGSGGFGLAVVPTNLKRADVDEVFTKAALSQFLEAAPQDIECIVVTRASKLNLKRLQDVEDAGIPIVFDLSGRTSPTKDIHDPLKGLFSRQPRSPYSLYTFNGRLNERQAALLGDALDKESAARMLQALQEAALEEASGFYRPQWASEIIDTLTFGHERIDSDAKDDAAEAPAASARMRTTTARSSTPWQFFFATFPPESMPSLDSAKAITRMHDVGVVWHKTLKEHGLSLYVDKRRGLMRKRGEEPFMPDKDNLQEVGRFLGIDVMIDSLYDGVPLDYII